MQKAVSRDAVLGVLPEQFLRQIRIPFVQRGTLLRSSAEEEVFLVDLGLAGVFVEKEKPIAIGEVVVIRFPLPGNAIPITAACRVAWRHGQGEPPRSPSLPPGMGLQFVEISPGDQERLRRHVVDYLRRGGGARRFAPRWPDPELEEGP
jgi:Tfp pilus assembly protein PilZ